MNPGHLLFLLSLGRGHTTRDVPPLQGSSRRRPESRGWRPWLFSTAPLGLDPAPKERQAVRTGT